jgi:hypothetical protein
MPPAVALLNYITVVYFGGFFAKLGYCAGVSLHITINMKKKNYKVIKLRAHGCKKT